MNVDQSKIKVISDKLIRSWIRCPRKAWLDSFGNKQQRIWNTHTTLRIDHQKNCLTKFINGSFGIGLQACKEGKNIIFGLNIEVDLPSKIILKAKHPVLKKTEGRSIWGEFAYQPIIAIQGKRVTRESKLSLAFNGNLLRRIQKSDVSTGIAISNLDQEINLEKVRFHKGIEKDLNESIEKLKVDLQCSIPPPIASNRKKCSICNWKRVCDTQAIEEGNLSEINGIGGKRKKILNQIGIKNIKNLAESNPSLIQEKMNEYGFQHSEISHQIIQQARVRTSGQKERLKTACSLKKLKNVPGFLIYDIESDPDVKHDFLHGFVRVPLINNDCKIIKRISYQPFLNIEKESENLLWKRIQKKLDNHNEWPILHYGETELISLCRLALSQGATKSEIDRLKMRLIDVHVLVKEFWCLPTNNYGLKSVSEFMGFKWSSKGVDGPKALLWWRQWKSSRPQKKTYSKNLQLIFQYNRDDCLATLEIIHWLLTHN